MNFMSSNVMKHDYDYTTTIIAEFMIDIAWLAYSWT